MREPIEATRLRMPIYQVDAFTDRPFGGNPAAVCVVAEWPADGLMQRIAAENNLSETAFVLPGPDVCGLRWFSPTHEVDLSGHATLAAGWVVLRRLEPGRREVRFDTRGGPLEVRLGDGSTLRLRLPAYRMAPVAEPPEDLVAGLGAPAEAVLRAVKNFYVVLRDAVAVRDLRPDLEALARLHPFGVSVTAPGSDVDFVSRYFAPSYGIPEDPVSGHPHCALVPYWAARLGHARLRARQLSGRGGSLECELLGEYVVIAGSVAPYLVGELCLDHPGGLGR